MAKRASNGRWSSSPPFQNRLADDTMPAEEPARAPLGLLASDSSLRILIVGSSGFIGTHLARHLRIEGHCVEGWGSKPREDHDCDRYVAVDLIDGDAVARQRGPWDAAAVLAGHSVPGAAWTIDMVLENVRMCARALQHLADVSPGMRVVLVSSGHVYAPGAGRRVESDPLGPRDFYGLSKRLCEDWACSLEDRLDIQRVRLFNQIGPGLPAGLVARDLIDRLRAGSGAVEMKGANSVRDFMDVRDGVRGLAALIEAGVPPGCVWNLCTGQGVTIERLAETLMDLMGQSRPLSFKAGAATELVGDPTRLRAATGWAPQYSLRDGLRTLMEETHG